MKLFKSKANYFIFNDKNDSCFVKKNSFKMNACWLEQSSERYLCGQAESKTSPVECIGFDSVVKL